MKMKKTSLNTTKVTDRKIKRIYLDGGDGGCRCFCYGLACLCR